MHLNTRALSSAQDYLSPPNKGGDTDAHRGIGEAKPDAWKRQVQEEIDSAAQDTVKWRIIYNYVPRNPANLCSTYIMSKHIASTSQSM